MLAERNKGEVRLFTWDDVRVWEYDLLVGNRADHIINSRMWNIICDFSCLDRRQSITPGLRYSYVFYAYLLALYLRLATSYWGLPNSTCTILSASFRCFPKFSPLVPHKIRPQSIPPVPQNSNFGGMPVSGVGCPYPIGHRCNQTK